MTLDGPLIDLDDRLRKAVQSFWTAREAQQTKQGQSGRIDAGTRGAVTGGGHVAALEGLVVAILRQAALPDVTVRIGRPEDPTEAKSKKQLELPGYYRPEKQWDMIVLWRGQLVAAIEFKAQVGPSFGNNINNRTEEAIGSAEDLWKAYREQRFGTAPEPFLGYFFLLEDAPEVHTSLSIKEPFFAVDPIFKADPTSSAEIHRRLRSRGVSYSARYEILCRRLKLERLYTATCLVLATRAADTRVTEPAEDLTFRRFIATLLGHAHTFTLSQPK